MKLGLMTVWFASLVMLAAPIAAESTEYFVSMTGNDVLNSGTTLETPFRSICKAASVAGPGDTISVRSGPPYTEFVRVWGTGTKDQPVVIRPYRSERPVIQGPGRLPTDPAFSCPSLKDEIEKARRDGKTVKTLVSIGGEYVEFRGFEVFGSLQTGISAYGTRGAKITGNTVHDSQGTGIWVGHDVRGSDDCSQWNGGNFSCGNSVEGNTVYNNVLRNFGKNGNGGWDQGIQASKSDGTLIGGNYSFRNSGEGIGGLSAKNITISNNVVYDNFSVGIYLDNVQDSVIEKNFIYSTGNRSYFRDSQPADGIMVANEAGPPYLKSIGNVATNNVVVGTRYGFQYGNFKGVENCTGDCQYDGGMESATVAGNTFVNSEGAAIKIDAVIPGASRNGGAIDNVIFNNIFYSAAQKALATGDTTGYTLSHNCWSNGDLGAFIGTDDVIGRDPLIAHPNRAADADVVLHPESLSRNNFQILWGSPCAHSGQSSSDLATDINGTVRTAPLSAGAFEVDGSPRVQGNPGYLSFGVLRLNDPSSVQQVSFTNTGRTPTRAVTSITGPFYVTEDRCDQATLLPGERCAVSVAVATNGLGGQNGIVNVGGAQVRLYGNVIDHDARGDFNVGLGTRGSKSARALGAAVGRIDTGITVRSGDVISISASGIVWSGVWATGWTGPVGWHTWKEPACCSFPFYARHIVPGSGDRAHPFSLLYRVGDGPVRFVGNGLKDRVHYGAAGKLVLFINSDNYSNGEGYYTAGVFVGRALN